MRLVFLGTPRFAVPSLEAIVRAGHDVAAALTQPDRPKGRGQQLAAPPVKETALALGLPVHQPERVKGQEIIELLAGLRADAMVVVGYGQILPQAMIDLAPLGIINVHASLLPKYRGAAPVQWAIANGETVTGVTTMRIDAGLDTGDILLQQSTPIGSEEDALELGRRLSIQGADLLVETLDGLARDAIRPRPQNHQEATRAPLLKKEDGLIDWSMPARAIHCRVRGFLPWPGCYTIFRGHRLHIWKARVWSEPAAQPAGRLIPHGQTLLASCGDDASLELVEVQLEGRNRIPAAAFLNGQRLVEYEVLGEPTI
ncbi:MAG: methionyl-tRNA formyltransferase [Acidobacteria bacterium]|nr:methionyl-tRNA formyltransferase [Acidobacteriota bacterium]